MTLLISALFALSFISLTLPSTILVSNFLILSTLAPIYAFNILLSTTIFILPPTLQMGIRFKSIVNFLSTINLPMAIIITNVSYSKELLTLAKIYKYEEKYSGQNDISIFKPENL